MTPEELGRVVHAEHVKQALASGGILVIPSPWQDLTDEHRACYIAQGQAAAAAYLTLSPDDCTGGVRFAPPVQRGAFNFDDTGNTPCPFLPWGDCIHDFDEPEPTAAPWKLDCCTGDVLSPKCWDNRLSQVARSIFSAVSVGFPIFLMREAPSPPCGNYRRICIER